MSLLSIILSILFIVGLFLNAFVGWRLQKLSAKRADNLESILNSTTFNRLDMLEQIVNERMKHLTDTSLLLAQMLEKHGDDGTI